MALALKVVMQNDMDFVNVILLYISVNSSTNAVCMRSAERHQAANVT